MDEEAALRWQDALDEIMAGRPSDIPCPFCGHKPLSVERTQHGTTRVACPSCKQFVEGNFQSS